MSFFSKLFGGGSFEELRAEADSRFEQKLFGDAKLAYEKAKAKAKGAPADAADHVTARIEACRDELARIRVAEAERLVGEGEPEIAMQELESAREIASSSVALKREIVARLEKMERSDARAAASDVHEATDEEIRIALGGTWEEEQRDEYEALGDEFRRIYIALAALAPGVVIPKKDAYRDGVPAEAAALRNSLEAVLEGAKDPHYLWFEVARARVLCDDREPAMDALRGFFKSVGPDEGGQTRIVAHHVLARLLDDAGDAEKAEAEMRAATEACPNEWIAWIALGQWYRSKKRYDEAREALKEGALEMSEQNPDWRLLLEVGLVERDSGNKAEAMRVLQSIVDIAATGGRTDFHPDVAVPLAELTEEAGSPRRAADLWRHLAQGSDVQNHYRYHRAAARILAKLGDTDEARRLLNRASEIAPDAEARADVQASIDALGTVAAAP